SRRGRRARGQSRRRPKPSVPGSHASEGRDRGDEGRMSENGMVNDLPPLLDERIAHIEQAVFEQIGEESGFSRSTTTVTAPPRRRWAVGLGVAAAFVGGILI